MQTGAEAPVPATNFSVARLRRNILGNSNLGAMFVNRQSRLANDHNRALGGDANFLFLNTKFRFSGAFARTFSPDRHGDDRLGKLEGEYQTDLIPALSSYVDIGKNFNHE